MVQIKDIKETIMKNKKILLIVILLMIPISLGYIGNMYKMETAKVNITVEDSQIFINEQPFIIKGVGYAPVPIGDDPNIKNKNYFISEYADLYDRDLPLLREMGANTIRLWSLRSDADHTDFLNKAYNNGKDPIYVIASFWIDPASNISSPYVRDKLKSDFRKMVAKNKDNPAILMWAVGNELHRRWVNDKNKLDDLFSLINEMAEEAHLEEGDNHRLVTTPLIDWNTIKIIEKYNPNMTHLDVWSIQLYRGKTFGKFFQEYANVSSKPMVILEFGIDSYDNINQVEYEDVQAEYAEYLWKEIENNSDVTSGGVITSYSDQWWKGRYVRDRSDDCPDYNPSFHSSCGNPIDSHPDKYDNVEWWGVMRIKENDNLPDIMEPKKVYYTLRTLWKGDRKGDNLNKDNT